jgi:hypothetical protein
LLPSSPLQKKIKKWNPLNPQTLSYLSQQSSINTASVSVPNSQLASATPLDSLLATSLHLAGSAWRHRRRSPLYRSRNKQLTPPISARNTWRKLWQEQPFTQWAILTMSSCLSRILMELSPLACFAFDKRTLRHFLLRYCVSIQLYAHTYACIVYVLVVIFFFFLIQVRLRRRELRSQAKVVPITLDQVHF